MVRTGGARLRSGAEERGSDRPVRQQLLNTLGVDCPFDHQDFDTRNRGNPYDAKDMRTQILFPVIGAICLAFSVGASAAPGYYQVTGPVLEVTDTMIVIQKGEEKWHLFRDDKTNVTGELKVGAKVTVEYKMTATSVEAKKPESDKPKKK